MVVYRVEVSHKWPRAYARALPTAISIVFTYLLLRVFSVAENVDVYAQSNVEFTVCTFAHDLKITQKRKIWFESLANSLDKIKHCLPKIDLILAISKQNSIAS